MNGLAIEFMRQQDLQGASRLWSRLAEQEPNDLELRLNLLDLAFQTANSDEIDKNIKQIERDRRERGVAGSLLPGALPDLAGPASRRQGPAGSPTTADQGSCPLKRTGVAPRELVGHSPGLGRAGAAGTASRRPEGRVKSRQRKRVSSALTAERSTLVSAVRPSCAARCSFCLRTNEAVRRLELLNSIPVESQLAGDLGRQAMQFAVESRDSSVPRRSRARPWTPTPVISRSDIWLVQILLS